MMTWALISAAVTIAALVFMAIDAGRQADAISRRMARLFWGLAVFVVVFLILMLPARSRAGDCGTVAAVKQQAVVAQVVTPVATVVTPVVQTIAVQPVLLPVYSAVYQPRETQSNSAELLAEIRALRSKVESLEGKPAPRLESRAPVGNLLSAKCASCHSSAAAETKGGGLTMFDALGSLSLTEEQKEESLARVAGKTMPKGEKLSPAERKQLVELLK
jgi:hypothetical protein